VPPTFSPPSVVTAPLSTFTRRFWPLSLTMRRRSTTGLKSMPKLVPERPV
jgi:hypothetical protein